MNTMKVLMSCKNHKDLNECINKILPSTLGYEFGAVLFSEDSLSLYSMLDKES